MTGQKNDPSAGWLRPTFVGCIATTIDAAYIVEAAVVAQTLPCHVKREGGSAITESGMVYVHGADFRRLRDGMSWTDGRNLGNGFNVYREKASSPMNALTEAELAAERENRAEHEPYLGALVGHRGSKRGGLIKKGIKFSIGGQEWGLTAYYTEADAKSGTLLRPRSQPMGSTLVAWGLSPDFFAQPAKTARKVAMVDDGGNGGQATGVFATRYPHSAAAAVAYAALARSAAPLPAPALPPASPLVPPGPPAAFPPQGPALASAGFSAPQPAQQPPPPAGAAACRPQLPPTAPVHVPGHGPYYPQPGTARLVPGNGYGYQEFGAGSPGFPPSPGFAPSPGLAPSSAPALPAPQGAQQTFLPAGAPAPAFWPGVDIDPMLSALFPGQEHDQSAAGWANGFAPPVAAPSPAPAPALSLFPPPPSPVAADAPPPPSPAVDQAAPVDEEGSFWAGTGEDSFVYPPPPAPWAPAVGGGAACGFEDGGWPEDPCVGLKDEAPPNLMDWTPGTEPTTGEGNFAAAGDDSVEDAGFCAPPAPAEEPALAPAPAPAAGAAPISAEDFTALFDLAMLDTAPPATEEANAVPAFDFAEGVNPAAGFDFVEGFHFDDEMWATDNAHRVEFAPAEDPVSAADLPLAARPLTPEEQNGASAFLNSALDPTEPSLRAYGWAPNNPPAQPAQPLPPPPPPPPLPPWIVLSSPTLRQPQQPALPPQNPARLTVPARTLGRPRPRPDARRPAAHLAPPPPPAAQVTQPTPRRLPQPGLPEPQKRQQQQPPPQHSRLNLPGQLLPRPQPQPAVLASPAAQGVDGDGEADSDSDSLFGGDGDVEMGDGDADEDEDSLFGGDVEMEEPEPAINEDELRQLMEADELDSTTGDQGLTGKDLARVGRMREFFRRWEVDGNFDRDELVRLGVLPPLPPGALEGIEEAGVLPGGDLEKLVKLREVEDRWKQTGVWDQEELTRLGLLGPSATLSPSSAPSPSSTPAPPSPTPAPPFSTPATSPVSPPPPPIPPEVAAILAGDLEELEDFAAAEAQFRTDWATSG